MAPTLIPLIVSRVAPALPALIRTVCVAESVMLSPSSAMLPYTPATGAPS